MKPEGFIITANPNPEISLDYMMSINNELINTKRQLFKKISALDRAKQEKDFEINTLLNDMKNYMFAVLSYADIDKIDDEDDGWAKFNTLETFYFLIDFILKLAEDLLNRSKIHIANARTGYEQINIDKIVQHSIQEQKERRRYIVKKLQIQYNKPSSAIRDMLINPGILRRDINHLLNDITETACDGGDIIVSLEGVDDQFKLSFRFESDCDESTLHEIFWRRQIITDKLVESESSFIRNDSNIEIKITGNIYYI
jgi:signal transduction histidine kinase